MASINIVCYSPSHESLWNDFVESSCNATFLFNRKFMDYHADRFEDASLIFYSNNVPCALLPANREGDTVYSHGGLTYGGLIVSASTATLTQLECMKMAMEYYQCQGIRHIIIKPLPDIYTTQPSQAIRYSLFRLGFTLTGCGLSMAVATQNKLPMRTLRKRGCRRAQRSGLVIREGNQYIAAFHKILTDVLATRHGVKPVHTVEEMQLLAARFSNEIRLYTVWQDGEIVAGSWVFVTQRVMHTQYIAASDTGGALGALDMLFCQLIERCASEYFDFGICTEQCGNILNEGLLFQKEGFGARPVVYEQWSLDLPAC